MAVDTYTKTGSKASTAATLDKAIFGIDKISQELLKQAYVAQRANKRANIASSKDRSDVRGGGAKPWRQKGTGRARHGSRRSPIWTGGGVTFGPTTDANYSKKLSKKSKQTAVKHALSAANASSRIKVIEALDLADAKTKSAAKLLEKLGAVDSCLLVVADVNEAMKRATANLEGVTLRRANYLTVVDLLNHSTIVIEKSALETITKWLGGAK